MLAHGIADKLETAAQSVTEFTELLTEEIKKQNNEQVKKQNNGRGARGDY